MKKKLSLYTISVLLFIFSIDLNGQVNPDSFCRPGSEQASFAVNFFLKANHLEAERIKSGTNNISENEIKVLDSELDCKKLLNFIYSNDKYKKVDAIRTDDFLYFYETNNFYYAFWLDNKIKLGPKILFLVISKDYLKVWEFYV